MTPLEIALGCWLIGCGLASVAQLVAPRRVAAASVWGAAPGWQREVGAWNGALCFTIGRALFVRNEACEVLLAQTVLVVAAGLGANHLAALRLRPTAIHALGVLANASGTALVVWGLLSK